MFRFAIVAPRATQLPSRRLLMPYPILCRHPSLRQPVSALQTPTRFLSSKIQKEQPQNKITHPEAATSAEKEPVVQVELDMEYEAKRTRDEVNYYDFTNKRFTITNYEHEKSGKISTVQIDGKDRSVNFLASVSNRMSVREVRDRAK